MALLATQQIVPGGLADALAAANGGGDTFTPGIDTFVRVNNGSGGSITVTIAVPQVIRGRSFTSISVVVAAGVSKMIGPFPADMFADPANSGLTTMTYSGVTSLTVGAFQLGEY